MKTTLNKTPDQIRVEQLQQVINAIKIELEILNNSPQTKEVVKNIKMYVSMLKEYKNLSYRLTK